MHSLLVKFRKLDSVKKWFYGLMALGLFASLISILVTRGESFKTILHGDENDMFMDFFNTIYYTKDGTPYQTGVIYPPLAELFLYFLSLIIPKDIMASGAFGVRASQIGIMLYTVYTTITTSIFVLMIYKFKRGHSVERITLVFISLLSFPYIFQLERGNILLIAVLFSMVFIFFKDSKSKAMRELAYIFLAIAAGIKIYPAVFGLLLIQEKRYKDAIKTMIYGIAFAILPFAFFGGTSSISQLFKNFRKYTELFQNLGYGFFLDIKNTVMMVFHIFDNTQPYTVQIGIYITFIFVAFALMSLFYTKENWKKIAICTLLLIAAPGGSVVYTLLFMTAPLILFLDSKLQRRKLDYAYVALYVMMFVPWTYGARNFVPKLASYYTTGLFTLYVKFAVIAMLTLLIVEGGIAFAKQFKANLLLNTTIAATAGVVLIGTTLACVTTALNI